jgi:hypothetical protein
MKLRLDCLLWLINQEDGRLYAGASFGIGQHGLRGGK